MLHQHLPTSVGKEEAYKIAAEKSKNSKGYGNTVFVYHHGDDGCYSLHAKEMHYAPIFAGGPVPTLETSFTNGIQNQ